MLQAQNLEIGMLHLCLLYYNSVNNHFKFLMVLMISHLLVLEISCFQIFFVMQNATSASLYLVGSSPILPHYVKKSTLTFKCYFTTITYSYKKGHRLILLGGTFLLGKPFRIAFLDKKKNLSYS